MGRYTYPHTIDNGAGERLTFMRLVGERLEGDTIVSPGAGPPMHVHFLQEEAFTVEEGRIGYQRPGESPQFAGPGETLVFKAGEPHRVWNAGDSTLRCSAHLEPAHNVEYLLTELFASQKRNGGKRPDTFDAAFLMTRYRSEYKLLELPAAVRHVVFPALVVIGRLLGKYSRYADAPEPVEAHSGH